MIANASAYDVMTYLPAPSATSSRRMVSQTMKPVSQRMITIQRKHHSMAMPRPLEHVRVIGYTSVDDA